MGTLPFFVENVSLLQLSALRLVRAVSIMYTYVCRYSSAVVCNILCIYLFTLQIFMRYDKHRDLILDEIFASLQRLPTNKRNLRSYKSVH